VRSFINFKENIMRIIHRVCLSLLLLFTIENIISASVTWTLVTSQDQIESGKIYMVAAFKATTTKSYYFFNPNIESSGIYKESYKYSKYNLPSSYETTNLNSFLCFKLTKETNGWTLYNIYTHKYNGIILSNQEFVFKSDDIVDNEDYWNVNINGSVFDIVPVNHPTYQILYNMSGDFLQPYTSSKKTNTDFLTPSLYKLTSYTLDESTDYKENDAIYSLPVTLNRSFTVNTYNTLVLPCNVNSYKTIFGVNTQAYELSSCITSGSKEINFTSVSSDNLTANKPYIVVGTAFNTAPYSLGDTELSSCNTQLTDVTDVANCSYIGVYSTTDLAGLDNYVLYNKKFYSCKSKTSPFNIAPYHCYFTLTDGSNAKFTIDDDMTNIKGVVDKETIQKDGIVYNLCGMKIKDEIPAQHGIYIRNGKKYVK
jgi:hypothetical protein